MISVAWPDT